MALMQITIIPVGTAGTSVGSYVAEIEKFLRSRDIEHALEDMGTVVYGTADMLLDIAREIHNLPFKSGAQRVITQITIDDRRDVDRNIGEKKNSVLSRLKK